LVDSVENTSAAFQMIALSFPSTFFKFVPQQLLIGILFNNAANYQVNIQQQSKMNKM
jgi:hypothetical protein